MYLKIRSVFPVMFLLCILFLWIAPVCADDGSVSVTYRGAGGYYIGDTILLDGKNTMGNMTVIRLTGPGLPAAGVPPYNLSDAAGTGNTIEVDPATGSWAFYWDTSRVENADKFYTARYTLTVFDKNHPDVTASTSVMLKKPEFYVSVSPNPATSNDYVIITGSSEKGTDTVEIDVLDSSGNKVHTFMAPVSSGGAFNCGFHVDMSPGQYTVEVSSPSLSNNLVKTLVVVASRAETSSNASVTIAPTLTTAEGSTASGTGVLIVSSKPTGATVSLDSAVVGKTPLTLDSVAAGTHTVELKMPGYLTSTTDIIVTSGQTSQIAPELVKSPGSLPLSPLLAIIGCLGAAGILVAVRRRK